MAEWDEKTIERARVWALVLAGLLTAISIWLAIRGWNACWQTPTTICEPKSPAAYRLVPLDDFDTLVVSV